MTRKAVLERTLGKKAAKQFLPKKPKAITFEIPTEVIEGVLAYELAKLHGSLTKDLKDRKAGKGIAIFSIDKDEDIAEISTHLRAIETVARYYGVTLK